MVSVAAVSREEPSAAAHPGRPDRFPSRAWPDRSSPIPWVIYPTGSNLTSRPRHEPRAIYRFLSIGGAAARAMLH